MSCSNREEIQTYKYELANTKRRKKLLHKFYKEFWKLFLNMSCSEKAAITEYKKLSFPLNSLLLLPDSKQFVKLLLEEELIKDDVPVSKFGTFLMQYIQKLLNHIYHFENIFLKAPTLNTDLIVFRGINKNQIDKWDTAKIGALWKTRSFLSTSLSFQVALAFALYNNEEEQGDNIILMINLPKSTPYIPLPGGIEQNYMDETDFHEFTEKKIILAYDQNEILLNKNLVFKITKKQRLEFEPERTGSKTGFKKKKYLRLYNLILMSDEDDDVKFQKTAQDILTEIEYVSFKFKTD